MKTNISKQIATFGPIGYIPGRGTIATFLTLPIVYLFHFFSNHTYFYLLLIFLVITFFIVHNALKFFTVNDPEEIVLDEFIGCLMTFFTIPLNKYSIATGFVLFRFFDILKPLGIKKIEQKFTGVFGIIADDIFAAVISNILLQIIFKLLIK